MERVGGKERERERERERENKRRRERERKREWETAVHRAETRGGRGGTHCGEIGQEEGPMHYIDRLRTDAVRGKVPAFSTWCRVARCAAERCGGAGVCVGEGGWGREGGSRSA